MSKPEASLSERLFSGNCAEIELEERLLAAGVCFTDLGWDEYDYSLEIHGAPPSYRMSEEAQRVVHKAGFLTAYVNHNDKWETHYRFQPAKDFQISKGWRISYPHKRGDGESGIWVEEFPHGWSKDWLASGYVIIKQNAGAGL